MNKRVKKKRGQAKRIEALERGNAYLADLTGRLMEEKSFMERGHQQIRRMMEGYIMVLVDELGGEIGVNLEGHRQKMAKNELVAEVKDGDVWFTVLERDEEEGVGDGKSD